MSDLTARGGIIIRPKRMMADFEPRTPFIWISISTEEKDFAENSSPFLKGKLELVFSDTDKPYPGIPFFDSEKAQKAIDFVEENLKKDPNLLVVCQCEAGRSRSAGLASGLAIVFNRHDIEKQIIDAPSLNPNRHIRKTVIDTAMPYDFSAFGKSDLER